MIIYNKKLAKLPFSVFKKHIKRYADEREPEVIYKLLGGKLPKKSKKEESN